ncbi:ABC transporter permease subunit [Acidaminobacter sp. JC074]|uniref:ABC transporter permease subunit n=1 Tax=Acidaminobacter sp. JC074 TaxID=2530199 RepID=UPI001F0E53F0|nr:ABC transporter permease subunit [Acidaminobacter sp. JC074]MCH4886109.1 ABC transporter permease subunit [Acidaminobacter sp. JC074]
MKRYIFWLISIIFIVFVPMTFFHVMGFHYDLNSIDSQAIIDKSNELLEMGVPSSGSKAHEDYRIGLMDELEALGFEIEIQEYQQLGPVYGEDQYLRVDDHEIRLHSANGGRSAGIDFTGDMVIQNLSSSYEKEYVNNRFVISTGFGNLSDVNLLKLYDAGCKGVIIANGYYEDGSIKLDYKKLDGKVMPIVYISEEDRDILFDLAKSSSEEKIQVSFGTSYTGVEFFDAGLIENVHIVVDKKIEVMTGYNIVATMGEGETYYFATHYDGNDSSSPYMRYQNVMSVSTMLELAKRIALDEKHLKKQAQFVFLDGGLLDQSGSKHFAGTIKEDMHGIYLDRLGMMNEMIVGSDGDSLFFRESLQQYDFDHILKVGSENVIDTARWDAPGLEAIRQEEHAILITADFQANLMPYYMGQNGTLSENLEGILDLFDRYIKVVYFEDNYPDYMRPLEWAVIFVLILVLVIINTLFHLKHIESVKLFYYSVPYSVFKLLVNAVFVVLITLGIILCITILPGYFNISGGSFNYGSYALWHEIISIIRGFIENGLGTSSAGIPYIEILIQHSSNTFRLITLGLIISVILGLTIGMISSYLRKGVNKQQSILIIFGLSIPETVLIIFMLFSMKYIMDIPFIAGTIEASDLRTLIMPLIVLTLVPTIYISRTVYMTLVEESQKKYIISLKAKGVKKMRIYSHHLLKVAFNKVLSHMPIIIAINIATMIICEKLFSLTGIFNTLIATISSGEYLFYLAIVLSIMLYYYLVTLTSKIVSRFIMPRTGGAYEVE